MKIIIICQCITEKSEIGREVILEYRALKKNKIKTYLYADVFDNELSSLIIDTCQLRDLSGDRQTVAILHYGSYWERIEQVLGFLNCRLYIKYHYIPPPHYVKPYSNDLYESQLLGMRQLSGMARYLNCWYIADSDFSAHEMAVLGISKENIKLLAPFHETLSFNGTKLKLNLLHALMDGKINVMSVGDISPNMGHRHLLEIIHSYINTYDREIRLTIIGHLDERLNQYHQYILGIIDLYDLNDIVCLRKSINMDELHTFYASAHIFLSMSEHDSFRTSILQAQYHKIPILALDCGAAKYTAGVDQILSQDIDVGFFSSAINVITNNNDLRQHVTAAGYANYMKYEENIILEEFTATLSQGN
jgi:hypothetical protein